MKTKRFISAIAATSIFALSGLGASILLSTAPSQAAQHCECVEYVKRRFGLSGAVGNAKDMGPALAARGFRQVSQPQVGAIAIFQPGFSRYTFVNQTYGHVGVISQVRNLGDKWQILVDNTNFGGHGVSLNCNNFSKNWYNPYPKNTSTVSYWVRGNTSNPPSGQKTYFIGDYALNTNNYFYRIDGYPIMSSWRRNDRDPDQHFERLRGNWGTLLKNKSTGKCLNAHYLYNGARVNVWPCNPSDPDQNWALNDLGGGYLQIKRANTNKNFCLDMPDRKDGGKVHLWDCNSGNPNQRWRTN
ncbi:MAG: ricin-type beta-trefoil lectin domain protein [Coleofasciculus sp. G1-WW12-02]|uniref:ricin-type beta-trefoil lectin domain protein n=1 Tax=Coleofasciculus sp. G1-WW12-02 TaxID=3068483 RepID=UPI0032FA3762